MRLDLFLQRTGIVKRRSVAKQLCELGAVELNGRKAKPSHEVSENDAIRVKFRKKACCYQALKIPGGSVRKDARTEYVVLTSEENFHED